MENSPHPYQPEGINSSPEARELSLSERTKMALFETKSSIESIEALRPEEQQDAIDDMALEVLSKDEESKTNIAALEAARHSDNKEEINRLTQKQRDLYQDVKREIAFMCGVELEDVETQKQEYRAKFLDKVQDLDPNLDDEQVMETLGFFQLTEDNTGKRFTFPEEIFPPYIREKWTMYAEYVENHLLATRLYQTGINDYSEDVVQWDSIRRHTHNNLAGLMLNFLQLDDWDLERCRKFVTKMLEKRLPSVETRESKLTSEAILKSARRDSLAVKAISNHNQNHTDSE